MFPAHESLSTRRAGPTRLASWLALAIAVASCGTESGALPRDGGKADQATRASGASPLPCDVDDVLTARCRQCHASPPLYGSPMPLVTYEDLHTASPSDPSTPVFARMGARIHADTKPMPPSPSARLDASELRVLDAWIAAGAPKGGGACGPSTAEDAGSLGVDGGKAASPACTDVVHVAPLSPFTMTSAEQYACYGFDVATPGKRHVIEIRPRIDNSKIVHHVLLLASGAASGGTPTPCDQAPSLGLGMLYAWAPGGAPLVVPPEAGFPQDQTTHYIVQVHYSNAANIAHAVDATGFDLCTTPKLRKYDADVIAFGTETIALLPHAPAQVTSCYTVPAAMDGRTFFAAFPHMHKLGKSMTTALLPGGNGAPVEMGTDAMWDFSSQPWLPIAATSHTGDVIKIKCAWNNTTTAPVTFGQNTENEMCYSFTAYYPKIVGSFGWSAPASGSVLCQ